METVNIGECVICIKPCIMSGDDKNVHTTLKGKEYIVVKTVNKNEPSLFKFAIIDEEEYIHWFKFDYEYFYTPNELRRIKLEKINGI